VAVTDVVARFTADIGDMQAKMLAVRGMLTATGDEATNLSQRLQVVGDGMATLGKKMTLGLTAPLAGIGVAAVMVQKDFDVAMKSLQVNANASADDMVRLSALAKQMGADTVFSAGESADAMLELSKGGLSIAAIEGGALAATMNLAATENMALADAAGIVVNSMNQFGVAAGESAQIADILAAGAVASTAGVYDLAGGLKYVGTTAKQFGYSINDTVTALAAMNNAGIDATSAGTSLNRFMLGLIGTTPKATKTMKELGLNFRDARGELLPLNQVVGILQQELSGLSAPERAQALKNIFGVEGMRAANIMLELGAQNFADLGEQVSKSGVAAELANARMSGMAGALEQLKGSLETAALEIGEVMAPYVIKLAEAIRSLVDRFLALPGPAQAIIVAMGAFAAALGPVLWIGGKVMVLVGALSAKFLVASAQVRTAATTIGASVKAMEVQIKTAMIASTTQTGALIAAFRVMGTSVVASLRGIGVALKGMVASFGPVGLALVGLTVAYEAFTSNQMETEQKVTSLTDAMKEQNNVIGELTAQNLASVFQEISYGFQNMRTFTSDIDALGVSMDQVVLAVLEGEDSINALGAAMGVTAGENLALKMAAANVFTVMKEQSGAVEEAKKEYEAYKSSVSVAKTVTEQAGLAVDGIADDFTGAADAAGDLEREVEKLSDLFLAFDADIAAIRAKDQLRGFLRDIEDELAKNNRALLGNGEAAMKNREAVLSALELAKADAVAWGEANGATLAQVEARFQKNAERVKSTLVTEGFKKRDLETFFGVDYVDVAGVTVGGKMITAIGTLADRLGPVALAEFKGVGRDIGAGLVAGVAASYTSVENETRLLINRAEQAARNAAQSKSPSQLFAAVGKDLVAGLVEGIDSEEENVRAAAKTVMVDWYQDVKADLKSNLDDAREMYREFAEGIQEDLLAGINLGAAYEAQFDEEGKKTGISLVDAFNAQIDQANWFGNVLQALRAKGVSDQFIQQIASMGPAAGGALGQQLLDQGLALTMSEKYDSVVAAMYKVGEALMPVSLLNGVNNAQSMYDGYTQEWGPGGKSREQFLAMWDKNGVDSGQSTYEGLKKNLGKGGPARGAIMNLMDNLANAMNRTATITVTTRHVSIFESIHLPGKALGGPVSARQAYIVGERGPEVFVPGYSGNIIPNNMLGSMSGAIPLSSGSGMASAGSTVVNVNVNAGMGTDGAEVGRQIVEQIKRFERTNGPVFAEA
jgi:TP901 family phage tail tape measure protein